MVGRCRHAISRCSVWACTPARAAKTRGSITFANTNPTYMAVVATWLRSEFQIDESRLRAKIYLHEGLDLDAGHRFWSQVLDAPSRPVHQAVSSG